MASKQLHILLFPFMGYGHMIPMVDLAMAFAARGARTTLLLSPGNYTAAFEASINQFNKAGGHAKISIRTIPFPVPVKSENTDSVTSKEEGTELFAAVEMMEQPFRELVQQLAPDCIVSDMLVPWTAEVAHALGIPRLVFNGFSYISLCIMHSLHRFKPDKELKSDMEPFTVPSLPDPIVLTRAQVPVVADNESSPVMWRLQEKIMEAGSKSYGTVMNSFLELEEAYVKHYTELNGDKTWHVGPLSLCMNRDIDQKLVITRGKSNSMDPQECVDWLNTKAESSVLYVCFGSVIKFAPTQIAETAAALESSSCSFIWVVKSSEVLPEGFEERIKEKGMVIRGWAPQVVIMGHPAIGGFVTHCGWNSALEGISAGLPMITWPGFADQFYNEKLFTQVLKVGVEVGVKRWVEWEEEVAEVVERGAIEDAIRKVMGDGEDRREMRRRAKVVGDMARKAIGEGGSSFLSLGNLIEELYAIRDKNTAY